MPRRPIFERQLLDYAAAHPEGFYGYEVAAQRPELTNPTIYRTLRRLEEHGQLTSSYGEATASGRPTRRIYRLKESKPVVTKPVVEKPTPRVVWQDNYTTRPDNVRR